MNIEEKWKSLFHHTIQSEKTLSPQVACEALVLIESMAEQWRKQMAADGYAVSPKEEEDIRTVCDALRRKAGKAAGIADVPWPVKILCAWEKKNPFKGQLKRDWLDSSWESWWAVQTSEATVFPGASAAGCGTVWVVASSLPLRRAWEKVLNVLLPGNRRNIVSLASVAGLPAGGATGADDVVVFGSPWDAAEQSAALESWQEKNRRDVMVIQSLSLMEVLKNISGRGEKVAEVCRVVRSPVRVV